jgi:diguanylate cyclase (GGDEF)-like protein/PAS domain S-box-containing protein
MITKFSTTVLVVEDNPRDARVLREMFSEQVSEVTYTDVECLADAERALAQGGIDVVLLDLGLPDAEGMEAIRRVQAIAPGVAIVVLTCVDSEAMAIQALQEGAQDYLVKGQIDTRGLLRSLRYAVERKFLRAALFNEEERAQVTLNCIGEAVICTDSLGKVTLLNVVAEAMTGWSFKEAAGRPLGEILQVMNSTSRVMVAVPTGAMLVAKPCVKFCPNCLLIHRGGRETAIEESIAPIYDREGLQTGAVVVFRDVSEARKNAAQMTHTAEHDSLTGLPNRLLLYDRVNQAIAFARRHKKRLAILFLDLDGFKHINDSFGHAAGDGLLQSVAKRLVDCGRASDTVSRHGGDEFVVVLSEVEHSEDAAIAARRMVEAVGEAHLVGEQEVHVSTSIGVSVYPDDGEDAETLVKNADTAMYQAKENGRQSFQFFKPAMNLRAVEREFIEQALRRALDRDEFTLHYQPKISFRTGLITGAEALLRWNHPVRGAIAPAEFIAVAEDCGLILPIGNWMLGKACEQARAWIDSGLSLVTMAVNVSALEFRDQHFVDSLFGILERSGLDPHVLELEVTEGVLMKHAESAATVLETVRRRGVRVALDDFGTGYSSLSYLRNFPIDALKIDQSFVAQITAAGDSASIVTAVISMARSLRLRVVAEGVETLEQLAFLQAHGCDEAQGYYFSRAVLPVQFGALLRSGIRASALSGTGNRFENEDAPGLVVLAQNNASGSECRPAGDSAASSGPRELNARTLE